MDATPDTAFLPAERLDQEAIHNIARDIAVSPTALPLSLLPMAVVIINNTRQIVYANERFVTLTVTGADSDVIGMRMGEALGCEHAGQSPGGCGTTRFCQFCGAAQAVVKSLGGERDTQECSINRVGPSTLDALNLQVWAVPLVIDGHELVLNTILDIAHEKALQSFERVFFHDIVNAVTGIKGLHDILTHDLQSNHADDLELMRQGIEAIEDIVETQQDFLRVEAKEYRASFAWIDSGELLDHLAAYCQSFIVDGLRRLVVAPDVKSETFSSDGRIVRRIMVNMIKNALEASRPGETVTIGCDRAPGSLILWTHNAAVLSEEVRMRIFEKGFTTKRVGRGFGTYSMRLFARQCLGGDISFTSTQEDGTRFFLTIPA